MSVEEKRKAAEQIGTLSSCLIEGDSEQKARERKIKRRALVISVVLQSLALVALVLVPLLGRTEKIAYQMVTPMPPYYRSTPRANEARQLVQPIRQECIVCFNRPLSQRPSLQSNLRQIDSSAGEGPDLGLPRGVPSGIPGMGGFDTGRSPAPPEDPNRNQKKRIVIGHIEPAMIIHRVEPLYPPLMRQIRKSGKVELRAIISTEGTIESLQTVSGDAGFYPSALDAVRQWRYKPTLLNGQAVEVETIITVIYSLGQQ